MSTPCWNSNTCQSVSESWPVEFWAFIFLFFAPPPSPHPQPLIPGVPSWVQAIWLSSPCNGAKVSNCKVQPQWPTTLSNYMVTNYRAQLQWAKHVVGNYRVQLQAVPNESVQLLKLTDCQITVEKVKRYKISENPIWENWERVMRDLFYLSQTNKCFTWHHFYFL